MKNSKNLSKKIFGTVVIICFAFVFDLYSMEHAVEQTPVQKHLAWLDTISNEAKSDVQSLIDNMCGLSRYLADYRDHNFLKKKKLGLNNLRQQEIFSQKLSLKLQRLALLKVNQFL